MKGVVARKKGYRSGQKTPNPVSEPLPTSKDVAPFVTTRGKVAEGALSFRVLAMGHRNDFDLSGKASVTQKV